ncbi:SHOCT domain-containing protein [Antarcticibacterium sp. 1MA-6-2]|uniref:SHOCT domain-containing protein n=1 Tax=Antarcticibacterium sp. 1MA-6-2 TaxID=2908210 RepID=UPI001F1E58F7|nr:SHOCT domain-containing protein [Antarcticibacterium sp. 1MA-6-2]UJH90909.1 SHOCT domain-containing protein [Antarcticibacterium sp. 1MA-6-2]
MKKITFLLLALLTLNAVQAQKKVEKLDEFTASNGITYKVGDEIKLGRGSDTDGRFVYVNMGGWGTVLAATSDANYNAEQNRLGAANSGLIVTIKKIKKYDQKRYKGVYFTVGGGNITNYVIDIENAIATCEVENCKDNENIAQSSTDKYDQLEKIKKLFDNGVLSKEEYEAEKKKVLEKGN